MLSERDYDKIYKNEVGDIMDFETLYKIKDETERVENLYKIFNEDERLKTKAGRVEFLTTVKYIEKYLKTNDRILDIGAGTGAYSFYFASKGFEVDAVELADRNIEVFKSKLTGNESINLRKGNAIDLSFFEDESFDIVLLFGPLYHIEDDEKVKKCILEAKRVCKKNGKVFFAFISSDFIILSEFSYRDNYFINGEYNKENFELENFPFVFRNLDECREIVKNDFKILHEVAVDGLSEMLSEKINKMDEKNYEQYLKFHFYICEKPEMVGHSNHYLIIGEKN